MFDLIEEELSNSKSSQKEGPVFEEAQNPIYTMPTSYGKEKARGSNKKILFIIFGVLFGLAIIATVVFLLLSKPTPPPPQQPVTPQTTNEQPTQQQPQVPVEQQNTQPAQTQPEAQQPSSTPVPQEPQKPQPVLGIDTDQDGLTDIEERLYSTDPQKNDTDGDSFSDGSEVKNLFDPLRGDHAGLAVSGLVNTYTNQTFRYSLLYPSSWVAKAVDRTDTEVMISSATGEFFTVTVQDNPNNLSPVDWYTTVVSPGADSSRLQSFAYDTWSGVMTEDSLIVYLTRNDKNPDAKKIMYVTKYSLNTKNEINFITTFQMLLKSFIFTDLSFVK